MKNKLFYFFSGCFTLLCFLATFIAGIYAGVFVSDEIDNAFDELQIEKD